MARRLLRSAFLALVAAAGCELAPDAAFTPQLNVHCLLFEDHAFVAARVNRTYAIDEAPTFLFPDAEVLVVHGGDTASLPWSDYDYYCSMCPDTWMFESGDTFRLRVSYPGFDTVFGTTVVPDTFSIIYPAAGDTVDFGDSLVWTRAADCAGYYLSLQQVDEEDTFYISVVIGNDSLPGVPYDSEYVWFPLQFMRDVDTGAYTIRLCALDSNYAQWVGLGGGELGGNEADCAGITGGVGVFGAATVSSVDVYLPWWTGAPAQSPVSNTSSTKSSPVPGNLACPPTSSRSPSTTSATGRASPAPPPE